MKVIYAFPAIVAAATLFSGACQKKESPNPPKKGGSPSAQVLEPSPPAEKEPAKDNPAPGTKIDHVSAVEAAGLIKKDPGLLVIDLRTPSEYATGHIPNTINIDFKSPAFADELKKLDPAKPYLIHCRSGGRSASSLDTFKALGFKHIIHLDGGMMDWGKEQLPVEK